MTAPTGSGQTVSVVCASNNARVLQENLARSPVISHGAWPLEVMADPQSAAWAYNCGLDATDTQIVVFAHHDVYLPRGWDALLAARIHEVAARDPDWAVIGAFGIGLSGQNYGPVWSSSIGAIIGQLALDPVPVQSLDELIIVLRRSSGLRFDEGLDGFHLYGTDIVQSARARGLGAYVCALPLVHNDGFKPGLDASFLRAYRQMQRKWGAILPIQTPILRITRLGLPIWRARLRNLRNRDLRAGIARDVGIDPLSYAAACGWGDLAAGLTDPHD